VTSRNDVTTIEKIHSHYFLSLMSFKPKPKNFRNFQHALKTASKDIPTRSTVPCNSTTPRAERASMVVAYQCTGCGDVVSIDGYCLCCPYDSSDDEADSYEHEGLKIQDDYRKLNQ